MNLKVRVKNAYFWIGILGVILTASGTAPETLTSWGAVIDWGKELVSNPYILVGVIISVLGVFHDPTTAGIRDSRLAMTYNNPKKGYIDEQELQAELAAEVEE